MKQANNQKEFKLFRPITGDNGHKIEVAYAALLTLGQNNQAEKEATDELPASDRRVMAVTGLTATEIDRLSAPDFNSLSGYVDQMRTQASVEFFGKTMDPDSPTLALPISVNGGEEVTTLSLQVPSVKQIRARDLVSNDVMTRALWLTSACTGAGPDDLLGLAMPDWLHLQVRLGDFLQQPAAYFHSGT